MTRLCRRGHDLDETGFYVHADGHHRCKECYKVNRQKRDAELRAANAVKTFADYARQRWDMRRTAERARTMEAMDLFVAAETAMPWEREELRQKARRMLE